MHALVFRATSLRACRCCETIPINQLLTPPSKDSGPDIETNQPAPDGAILFPGDVYRQTQARLVLIGESLRALGMDFSAVIKTRIYVAEPRRWADRGRAHAVVFRDIRPALSWVYMSAFFNPDIMAGVECSAYRAF